MPTPYESFCGDICRNFDKPWTQVGAKLDFCHQYLDYIPDHAWQPMVRIAIDNWTGWPRNWTKAVKEVYELWRKSAPIERSVTACDKCNGNGFFSSNARIEVKPGVFMAYRHLWRCAACNNWFGKIGIEVPANYPLQVRSLGHDILLYDIPASPDQQLSRSDLSALLYTAGHRINPRTNRPDIQHYYDN